MAESKTLDPVLEKALKVMSVNNGNVQMLDTKELQMVIQHLCEISGLNWETSPFQIMVNKKAGTEKLYAGREACAQLSVSHRLNVVITERTINADLAIWGARVSSPDGRSTDGTGACSLEGLKGEDKANKLMHAETKAKRRTILDHCGLGMLDEIEVATIPGIETKEPPKPVLSTQSKDSSPAASIAPTATQDSTTTPASVASDAPSKPEVPPVPKSPEQPATGHAEPSITQISANTEYTEASPNPLFPGMPAVSALINKAKQVWPNEPKNESLAKMLRENYQVSWATRFATFTHENIKLANDVLDQALAAKK